MTTEPSVAKARPSGTVPGSSATSRRAPRSHPAGCRTRPARRAWTPAPTARGRPGRPRSRSGSRAASARPHRGPAAADHQDQPVAAVPGPGVGVVERPVRAERTPVGDPQRDPGRAGRPGRRGGVAPRRPAHHRAVGRVAGVDAPLPVRRQAQRPAARRRRLRGRRHPPRHDRSGPSRRSPRASRPGVRQMPSAWSMPVAICSIACERDDGLHPVTVLMLGPGWRCAAGRRRAPASVPAVRPVVAACRAPVFASHACRSGFRRRHPRLYIVEHAPSPIAGRAGRQRPADGRATCTWSSWAATAPCARCAACPTTIRPGETLGLVGESGSGKSVSALSLLGLLPQARRPRDHGQRAMFEGRDLVGHARGRSCEGIRGDRIAMIFQDPLSSLNPVLTDRRARSPRRSRPTAG